MGSNDCARAVLIDECRGQTNQGSLIVLGKLTHGVVFAVGCAGGVCWGARGDGGSLAGEV